jgi:hypothetical protein
MLYELIFPWVLTFAIVFGLLIKTKLFGTDQTGRGVSGIISLALGFFLVAFTPWGSSVGQFFISASGITVMFLIAILGIALVVELAAPKYMEELEGGKKTLALIIIIFAAWVILGGLTGGVGWYSGFAGQDLVALIIILAVIGVMMWFVTSSAQTGAPSAENK